MLKTAGERLITIHGQHDNTSLLAKKTHLGFLDSYGGEDVAVAKNEYSELHKEINRIQKIIDSLDNDEKDAQRRAELLNFQIEEIDMSGIFVGEDEELEDRKTVIENAYKIAAGTSKAYSALYEGGDVGQSAYDALWTALKAIEPLTRYDKSLEESYSALSDASDVISENARFLKNYCEDVESTGSELDDIETRLDDIQTLKIKYGSTIELILKKREEMAEELDGINSSDERVKELKRALEKLLPQREKAAQKLRDIRKAYAEKLAVEVTESLSELCMPNVRFDTDLKPSDFRSDGADDVEFIICTNAGEGMKPLAQIASGGELSRIMLAIKGALADAEDSRLMIFDEVDTGVSGAAAQKIGEKLWKTSRYSQVICITHLPQIAAMADNHYLIEKHTDGERTRTSVNLLSGDERAKEVARTLGGAEITDAAMNNAYELIQLAKEYKSLGGK
jgi:DNA repair protein RecN (Recombination protein N)